MRPSLKSLTRNLSFTVTAGLIAALTQVSSAAGTPTEIELVPETASPSFIDDMEARGDKPSAQKGYDIAKRSDRTDFGFQNSIVTAQMVLRNAAGQETKRSFAFHTLEKTSEQVGDKSLVVFQNPPDVEGTSLLSHANILDPDDQWLFLPALKRVKRISSANKSGPFVGSEFAFEDFTITELNKFTYEFVEETDLEDLPVDVVDRFPRYQKSGYTRQRSYIDQEIFQPRKVEFFDRKGDLLKTLLLQDYRDYDGVWRPHIMKMVNHQTGKSTDLVYDDFEFGVGLGDRDFSKGVLGRAR